MLKVKDGKVMSEFGQLNCTITGVGITVDDLKQPVPSDLSAHEMDSFVRENCYHDSLGFIYCKEEGLKLKPCSHCGELNHPDRMTDVGNGKLVCNRCRDEHYIQCAHCQRWFLRDGRRSYGTMWIVCVGTERVRQFLCNECTGNGDFSPFTTGHYRMCRHCGDLVLEGEGHSYPDEEDDVCCERCYMALNGDVIHQYHYRRDPGYGMPFLGVETRKKFPLMGVELEVERGGENDEKATKVRTAIGKQYVVACHDGSLYNGFEIISCPANLKHHLGTLKWKDGMKVASELGYRSHDGGHCGLHVHIDREFFDGQDKNDVEAKFFISFRNNLDWIRIFSRRFDYSYCVVNGYEEADDGSRDTLGAIPYPPDKVWVASKKQTEGRHSALNFEPQNTIEIRIFRGTLNYKTFVATLQFVHMWANFVKETSYEKITRLRLQNFVSVAENQGFNEFIEYLKDRNIIEGKETGF